MIDLKTFRWILSIELSALASMILLLTDKPFSFAKNLFLYQEEMVKDLLVIGIVIAAVIQVSEWLWIFKKDWCSKDKLPQQTQFD